MLAAIRGELRQLCKHSSDSWSHHSPEDGAGAGSSVQYQAVASADDDQTDFMQVDGRGSKVQQLDRDSGCSTGTISAQQQQQGASQSAYADGVILASDGSGGFGRSSSRGRSSSGGLQGRGSGRSSPRPDAFV